MLGLSFTANMAFYAKSDIPRRDIQTLGFLWGDINSWVPISWGKKEFLGRQTLWRRDQRRAQGLSSASGVAMHPYRWIGYKIACYRGLPFLVDPSE